MLALGRLVNHDPRSRDYPAHGAAQLRSILWPHTAPVFDQRGSNSCTGQALAQLLNTTRFAASRPTRRYLDIQTAYDLYSAATQIDEYPWTWPPKDRGSSPLAVCKAGVSAGYLSGYTHCFGLDHLLAALQTQPVLVGTNWYQGMTYLTDGVGKLTGRMLGGHEYVCLGVDVRAEQLIFLNSWSATWGSNGRFRLSFTDVEKLLAAQGDVTAPTGKVNP